MNTRNIEIKGFAENLPFFFILGRPRSGTSLLRILFDAHPNIQIPIESPIIIDLYPKYGKNTFWEKDLLLEFYHDLFELRRFNDWRIDKSKLKNDLLSCEGSNSFQNICKVVHLNYISVFDKKEIELIGDKNPHYSLEVEKLIRLFPDAKFIHLRRDYRDHYLSMKRADFYDSRLSLIIYNWKRSEKTLRKLKSKFKNSFFTLNYEDFVKKPEEYLITMMRFLNCEYRAEVLDFHKHHNKLKQIYGEEGFTRFFGSLMQPISDDKVDQWKSEMKENEIRIADFIAGRYADKAGYIRKYNRSTINLWFYMLPRLVVIKSYNFYESILAKLSIPMQKRIKKIIPGPVKFYAKVFKS